MVIAVPFWVHAIGRWTLAEATDWLSAIAYWAVTNCSEISGTSWNQHNHNCDLILRNKKKSHDVGLHLTWGGGGIMRWNTEGYDYKPYYTDIADSDTIAWSDRKLHYLLYSVLVASSGLLDMPLYGLFKESEGTGNFTSRKKVRVMTYLPSDLTCR